MRLQYCRNKAFAFMNVNGISWLKRNGYVRLKSDVDFEVFVDAKQ